MREWLADVVGVRCVTVYCAWGKPYMKPTAIASNFPELVGIERRCSRDHPHTVLRGTNKKGEFLTALASAYPESLCKAWAACVQRAHDRIASLESTKRVERPTLPSIPENKPLESNPVCEEVSWPALHPHEINFPMVPDSFLDPSSQTLLYNFAWLREEHIHLLEGRASLKALSHATRSPGLRDSRVLFLCDNMSVVMSFNKGRARSFPLLRLCRKACASALAAGVVGTWRYVETKRNCADEPTRPSLAAPPVCLSHGDRGLRQLDLPAPAEQKAGFGKHGRHM